MSKVVFEDVVEFLKKGVGMGELEVSLYFELLKNGEMSMCSISKKLNLSRFKVSELASNLSSLGLVSKIKKENSWAVVPHDPSCLKHLVEKKYVDAKNIKDNVDNVILSFNNLLPCLSSTTQYPVNFFEGKTSVWHVYLQILNSTEIFSFSDIDLYYSLYPETSHLWDQAFEQNPSRTIFEISPETPLTRAISSHPLSHTYSYHTQLISPQNFNYSRSDIIAFDDSLALINLDPENPTATVINSSIIANNFKQIHKMAWKQTNKCHTPHKCCV